MTRLFGALALVAALFATCARAQEIDTLDDLIWRKDISTGREIAASRSDPSLNFFDVGNLSSYSQHLVEQDLRRLSAAAGLTIDHTPATHSTVAIIHASTVFEELKTNKPEFNRLGLPDNVLATLEKTGDEVGHDKMRDHDYYKRQRREHRYYNYSALREVRCVPFERGAQYIWDFRG